MTQFINLFNNIYKIKFIIGIRIYTYFSNKYCTMPKILLIKVGIIIMNLHKKEKAIVSVTKEDYLSSLKLINDSLSIPSIVIDSDNNIKYASTALIKSLGIKSHNSLADKNILDNKMPKYLALYKKFPNEIIAQHKKIITEELPKVYLETYRYNDETVTLFATKTPIFDSENNFIFMHIVYKQFTVARIANLAHKFYGMGNFPTESKDFDKIKLTRMEGMVLYLYARNYSYTEVSTLLSSIGHKISPTMVNKHLYNLKTIFDVKTNDQLKDVSLKIGYDVAIPAEFMPEGSHDITGDIFELWVC